MHYEEKVIEGILFYRTAPTENFRPMTKQQLTEKLLRGRTCFQRIKEERNHFNDWQWDKIVLAFLH